MLGLLVSPFVIALAALIAVQRATAEERKLLLGGLVAHVVGAGAIVVYHQNVYEGGDMLLYHDFGRRVAELLATDARWFIDVGKLLLHLDNDLRLEFFQNSSSGTMVGLMSLVIFFAGDNLFAICLIVSMFAYLGQVMFYRALAWRLEPHERRGLLAVFMLLPSVVFWSSGFIKEAIVIGFLGLACRAGAALIAERRIAYALLVGPPSIFAIALVKPYTLFPLALAIGGWVYASRSGKGVGLGFKVLGLAVALGGVFTASVIFPDFAFSQLGQNLAQQQYNYTAIGDAGFSVDIGNADLEADTSLAGQVKFFPLALLNSLARPFFFEARSASTMIAAVEMTVVVVLVVLVVRRASLRELVAEITRRPPLMFAFVFVFTFSLAVGLATRNLGTLSRYRAPVLPLYVGLLTVLRARFGARAPAPTGATPLAGNVRSMRPAERYLAARRAAMALASTRKP